MSNKCNLVRAETALDASAGRLEAASAEPLALGNVRNAIAFLQNEI